MTPLNHLENVSRRGFIGGGVALSLVAQSTPSEAVGTAEPLAEGDLGGFVRTFNTIAVSLFMNANHVESWENKKGFFPDKRQILVEIVDSLLRDQHDFDWVQKFTPAGKEVFPGWTLDYDASHEGHFVVIVRGPKSTYISDDSGMHYHALTPTTAPSAKDLMRADQFPGAVDFDTPLHHRESEH
jgi:hypothetical protein